MSQATTSEHVRELCQSCGMPLEGQPRGTTATGSPVNDYCAHCYQGGHYTEPSLQKEDMIAKVAGFLVGAERMNPVAADLLARRTLSGLKRWLDGAA